MTVESVWLLASLFLAHFLGDFTPLSTPRMQAAKSRGKPLGPIAAHAGVHALLVGLAVTLLARPGPALLLVAVGFEFTTHLAIDWFRGRLGGRYPALQDHGGQAFWTTMGLDQLAHYLALLAIASIVT